MKEIADRLHDNRQIELAKSILESRGYEVTKINEDISEPQYCVIKPDGTYAGAPCFSEEEAREMMYASGEEGRKLYKLVKVEDNYEVYSYVFLAPNDMAGEDLSSSIADIINRSGAENRGVKKSAGKYYISFTCPGENLNGVLSSIEGSRLFRSWVEE